MRQAHIFYKDQLAGILDRKRCRIRVPLFAGISLWGNGKGCQPDIALTSRCIYKSCVVSIFDGLIPEGWLLDVALRNTDISILDRMSLLMTCCKDCIGAVSVVPIGEKEVSHV